MDVLLCRAQVPFMRGGAELLLENLAAAFARAGHRAEEVRLPAAWDRGRVFDAALAWRLVPADADLVVATNFPSYFVQHPRKVVWLFHQHRAAYDLAGSTWSDVGDDDASLEVQRQLAQWDAVALSEARHRFTLSSVVSDRLARFTGLPSEPLHHPAPLHDVLHPGPFGDQVFCPLRLEGNKRPGLMVEAWAHVRSGTRLALGGRGTLHDQLVAQAASLGVADRVDLLGWLDDDDVVRRFASCLAVMYVPYDEDYGYVALQGARAAKPVITAGDSGGVLDWVEDGVTGFVTDGSPQALAGAVDRLAADRALAERMGRAGAERVAGLSWDPVVQRLLSAAGL